MVMCTVRVDIIIDSDAAGGLSRPVRGMVNAPSGR